MIKFRPSHLSAISQCPRFVRTETPPKEMDEAAEEGTDFHAEMERVAKADDHAAALAALPEGPAKVYAAWCWESIQGILDAGGEIIGAEVTVPESSVAKQGTADLLLAPVAWSKEMLVLCDWKFTLVAGENDAQLTAYAVGCFEMFPECQQIEVTIIVPKAKVRQNTIYQRADLPRILEQMRALYADAENPFVPGRPGPVCHLCKWPGKCTAQNALVVPISAEAGLPISFGDLLHPTTDKARSVRRYVADWLLDFAEGVKKDDAKFVKAGGNAPLGYKLVSRPGIAGLPKEHRAEAMNRLLSFGVPLDMIMGASNLSLKQLSEDYSAVAGGDASDVKVELQKQLSGLLAEGAGSKHLSRVSKKSLKQLFDEARAIAP